ncbi:MAG: hypothetical protein HPY71_03875 [Firmicutes bacterium]|nr:hypothetical protein [Bacillota bacterium]
MIDTHVLLPESEYEWLRRKAYEEHKSVAQVIREIIQQAKAEAEAKAGKPSK